MPRLLGIPLKSLQPGCLLSLTLSQVSTCAVLACWPVIIPDRRLVRDVPLRAGRMTAGWVLDGTDANKRVQISREARKELPGKKNLLKTRNTSDKTETIFFRFTCSELSFIKHSGYLLLHSVVRPWDSEIGYLASKSQICGIENMYSLCVYIDFVWQINANT